MGDFDRHVSPETAAKKEKKKLVVVGTLGVALLGTLGYNLTKGPKVAMAKEGGAAAELAVPEQTPAQVLAALDPARDPTAHLLAGAEVFPASLLKVPRDPFLISPKWRATLVKTAEPVKTVGPVETHVRPEPVPEALIAADFKLSGIFHQDRSLCAIINGSIVTVGATVGKALVVEIRDDRVVLRPADAPQAPTTTLNIQGKLR